MVFPGIFGTPHIIEQPTHSPFTDVSINKDSFKKIFLKKVSCCWLTCEKFVFNVSLPIILRDKPTQYSTQYLTYIVSFGAQPSPYSNAMCNNCKVCCSSNQCLFWWGQFCCNLLSSCSVFFFIPLVLRLVWPLVLSCPKSHIPFIFASHSVYFAENCGCYGKNGKQIFFQNSDTIMLLQPWKINIGVLEWNK